MGLAKDLFVTWCAMTRTTERAARRRGARYFLPALFVQRFSNFGGLDPAVFAAQLDACRGFDDAVWVTHWRAIADEHLAGADAALATLGAPMTSSLLSASEPDQGMLARLGAALSPAVSVLADRTPENGPTIVDVLVQEHPECRDAAVAVDELVKAMVYLFVTSWPGWSPGRLAAYRDSQRLMHVLLVALAPAMEITVERLSVPVEGEDALGYAIFSNHSIGPQAAVLITNGLEGTIQEALVPTLTSRHRGLATVVMEMPGTFGYTQRLSVDSSRIYTAVIDTMVDHHRIDPARIGMLGFSFGANWSTRMAALDHRLKAVVSNGGLYHRSFAPSGTLGMSEIMLTTLANTVGAKNSLDLGRKLSALSVKGLYSKIRIPLLVINGDHDTLASTQDSVDLAEAVPGAEVKLYPNDDHCAMGHYTEWSEYSTAWLLDRMA